MPCECSSAPFSPSSSEASKEAARCADCGYEGRVLNMLHSPLTTVHTDRWPLYAPAMWIGRCYPNGTTKLGWTHEKFKAHLEFLDTVGITRIGIWCECSAATICHHVIV